MQLIFLVRLNYDTLLYMLVDEHYIFIMDNDDIQLLHNINIKHLVNHKWFATHAKIWKYGVYFEDCAYG